MKDKIKKFIKKFGLPLTMVIAFSVIFKDALLGLLFGWVFYIANDKKDCCK